MSDKLSAREAVEEIRKLHDGVEAPHAWSVRRHARLNFYDEVGAILSRVSEEPTQESAMKLPEEVEEDFWTAGSDDRDDRQAALARIRARLEEALADRRPPDTEADGCVYCGCCGHGPK